jgi:hypothetical protein
MVVAGSGVDHIVARRARDDVVAGAAHDRRRAAEAGELELRRGSAEQCEGQRGSADTDQDHEPEAELSHAATLTRAVASVQISSTAEAIGSGFQG